ncbi:IS5 family transposase, partial [Pseudomonas aeruginosa]|nr:IS5 family transposase [Pseudomonas aeruginosa]MDI4161210.1 IS5 family transposase [Pseudomonas aeruginosa]
SRMTRECHVRFCERLRGQFPRPTHHFGMKAHIGADSESGLVHSVVGTAANVADVTQVDQLLHGDENLVSGDAGYTGVEKRAEHAGRPVIWQIAARRSTYQQLSKRSPLYKAKRKIEKAKAQVRAKVEHPFRVIKRQFGYTKVRFRGLAKNTAQLITLFALSNLWMVRRHLLANTGEVRL